MPRTWGVLAFSLLLAVLAAPLARAQQPGAIEIRQGVVEQITPTQITSWGRIKGTYRR